MLGMVILVVQFEGVPTTVEFNMCSNFRIIVAPNVAFGPLLPGMQACASLLSDSLSPWAAHE